MSTDSESEASQAENLPSISFTELDQKAEAYADAMDAARSRESLSLKFHQTEAGLREARKQAFSQFMQRHFAVTPARNNNAS